MPALISPETFDDTRDGTPNVHSGDHSLERATINAIITDALAEFAALAAADTTEAAARAAADALRIPLSQKGAANGVATLGTDLLIPSSQIPAIAITTYLGNAVNQAAMLAFVGQRGDWCTRSDRGTTWIVIAEPSSVLGNWKELPTPTDLVLSVNGQAGVVVLGYADVGADPAGAASAAEAAAIAASQPSNATLTLLAGLTTTLFGRGFLTVEDAAEAITKLGLGTAATKDTPASGDAAADEVVLGDDSRLVAPIPFIRRVPPTRGVCTNIYIRALGEVTTGTFQVSFQGVTTAVLDGATVTLGELVAAMNAAYGSVVIALDVTENADPSLTVWSSGGNYTLVYVGDLAFADIEDTAIVNDTTDAGMRVDVDNGGTAADPVGVLGQLYVDLSTPSQDDVYEWVGAVPAAYVPGGWMTHRAVEITAQINAASINYAANFGNALYDPLGAAAAVAPSGVVYGFVTTGAGTSGGGPNIAVASGVGRPSTFQTPEGTFAGPSGVALLAGDPDNPRIDTIVLAAFDASTWAVSVAGGAADPSPVAPTLETYEIPLADVLVPAGATDSADCTITDRRTFVVSTRAETPTPLVSPNGHRWTPTVNNAGVVTTIDRGA